MICNDCVLGFFYEPLNIAVIGVSLFVALVSLFFILKKGLPSGRKVFFIYLHVFALVFPFAFYLFFNGCQALFSGCSSVLPIAYLIGFTGVISAIFGSIAAPYIFVLSKSRSSSEFKDRRLVEFVKKESGDLGMNPPKIYLIDTGKPAAFSFSNIRPVIFVSVGMLDLLSRKEAEAVLLHELMHIRSGTSVIRFSSFFIRLFSPLSYFVSLRHELNDEERRADKFACERQATSRHILSAKSKVDLFFEYQKSK